MKVDETKTKNRIILKVNTNVFFLRIDIAQTSRGCMLVLQGNYKSSILNPIPFSSFNERNSFTCSVSRLWNSLFSLDLSLPTHSIIVLLKKQLWNHFKSHFAPLESCTFHYLSLYAQTALKYLIVIISPYFSYSIHKRLVTSSSYLSAISQANSLIGPLIHLPFEFCNRIVEK